MNIEWQKAIVERLRRHGLALQEASVGLQKWSDAQVAWVEKIQHLEVTQQTADLQI